jgi:hypothetical protein
MQFQVRDGAILWAIYVYGGLLARRHLKQVFWPDATLRAAQKRLAKLVDNGYLVRPTVHQRRTQPIPEPCIYWLGGKGILWVAAQMGVHVDTPANEGENQMRRLTQQLRNRGIRWLREPRWIQILHDLTIVDIRFAVERAVGEVPGLRLEVWLHESEFRSDWDTVKYRVTDRDNKVRWMKKRVYPDSYFEILDERRVAQGEFARAKLLLEIDNATHTNKRFGQQKVAPGLAYIRSPEYAARFGSNTGRWLVVTTGQRRMRNLMRQTRQVAGTKSGIFLFATFDQLGTGNVLTDPVWWQVGREDPIPLFVVD